MNRNIIILNICIILLLESGSSFGCLGNTINIGILNTDRTRLLAELVSQTINERTGTNVRLLIYDTYKDLHESLNITSRDNRIDMMIEDFEKFKETTKNKNNTLSKITEHTDLHDKKNSVSFIQMPLVIDNPDEEISDLMIFYLSDLLNDFPQLPRLFNKLSFRLNSKTYIQLLQYVEDGEKPRNVAKEFLKRKNLI